MKLVIIEYTGLKLILNKVYLLDSYVFRKTAFVMETKMLFINNKEKKYVEIQKIYLDNGGEFQIKASNTIK